MRIMIKGGVYKNTEDEILKAAVMKYGKNQWARISSLLVRKSAKQCKARWYEWLDPSIKKMEWTREEDEKLLHLAKLMPTQWRTIAPIVGRTPSQCLERYEKLLDAACVKDENYEPGDDPRKLRPGEIDPNPESKPARPDPVDMDEDEKEMLCEARARFANTKGKKAKRKAREKQLENARRLASLQKMRELKAAGIETWQRKRKRNGIDYNSEIPFKKRPPPGFFDVTDEDRPVEQPKFPATIEELEGKRRVGVEAQLRKQGIAKNKIVQRQDAPSAILQANKLNDPETVRKRSKLMLPAPQISVHDMGEIARMGYAWDLLAGSEELAKGSGATRALLANYAQAPRQEMAPLRTPQRTPAGKGDALIMEAENLARLRESQTPLLGGENLELHLSDFSGVTPKKKEIQTANPMLTPLATPGHVGLTTGIGMTPSRDGYSFSTTPRDTPIRDELHIYKDMDKHDLRKNLHSGLRNLPQPRNEYHIVIQPAPEDNEESEEKIEEDVSDRYENESLDESVEAQKTCVSELMFFSTRNALGLSSVAGNMEKLTALQNEYENVKKRMDADNDKAKNHEKKIRVLTQGYQKREETLWSKIEVTFEQIDTTGTELESFQAFQKQEQMAASHRINGLREDVQKQKELEKTLQTRYGNLMAELERIQGLSMNAEFKHKSKKEVAAS